MNKHFFSLCFLITMVLSANAQSALEGKVTDKNKRNMPYVTVRLFDKDSLFVQGSITDSLGLYKFESLSAGSYILLHSYIGYATQYVSTRIQEGEKKFLDVTLQEDNVMLNEVEIKGTSFIRQKDRIVIIPDKQQVKHAGTGYDLLYNLMIPGLDVDRKKGEVSTFGQTVSLYIDGRKVDYREIQSLRPQDITKVEYIDAPSGKYVGEIAAINYITKQYTSGGYVALDGRQTIGYLEGDYNAVAKIAHGQTGYTLFAGHNMLRHSGERAENRELFKLPDYDISRDYTTTDAQTKRNNQYAQLNIQNKNDKRTLLARISLVRNTQPHNYTATSLDYRGGYTGQEESRKNTDQKGLMPSLGLYGDFRIASNQHLEISLSGSYSDNQYSYNYKENQYESFRKTDEDLYDLAANANYYIQLKHNNTLAFQLHHIQKVSMATYSDATELWQHLWTGETILYGEYAHQLSSKASLLVRPGISSLQYKLHGGNHVSQISPRLRMSFNLRPDSRQFMQVNAAIGNSFPNIQMLNEVEQAIDILQVRKGNPHLKNTVLYTVTGVYGIHLGKVNLQGVGMYSFFQNMALEDYTTENNLLVRSYRTDINLQQAHASLSLTWKARKNLHLKVDGQYNMIKCCGGVNENWESWSGRADLNYYWKDFAFNVYGKTEAKGWSTGRINIYQPASYGVSANWSSGAWRIEAGADNFFTRHAYWKQVLHTDVYDLNGKFTGETYQQNGYIKVAYTFDFGKKTSRDSKNINTTINSAILKAE